MTLATRISRWTFNLKIKLISKIRLISLYHTYHSTSGLSSYNVFIIWICTVFTSKLQSMTE